MIPKSEMLFFIVPLLLGYLLVRAFLSAHGETLNPNEWAGFGHDVSNNKFSSLDLIDTSNVAQLRQLWQYEEQVEGGSSIFFNPLVVNGKMIAFMPSGKLVALDPASGNLLWEFTPDSSSISTWTKGITFHKGAWGRPDVLLFIHGATLYSIHADDGTLNESFGKNGRVDFYEGLSVAPDQRDKIAVTANAPGVVYENVFIVGCKVPDELPSTSGDIRAFDVNTGKLEWVFHTIPKKGEFGADTWPENARDKNGGANCWGGMALDKKRGIVYVPTASPSFDFYGADREGQNLFANCLLALDAKTGKRVWHFQTTHHDLWDRDNGSPPNLVRVVHEGKSVDAVALVTKMGYLFLFDRETGEPLFPIEEVAVPTRSEMPGEKPWPTQPFPLKPAPFARQGFKAEYYGALDSTTTQYIAGEVSRLNYNTGIYEPPGLTGSVIVPAAHGGANWGGASVNPHSGLLFVNAVDMPWFLQLTELSEFAAGNQLGGQTLFQMYCSSCHGRDQRGTGYGPDILDKLKNYTAKKLDDFIKKGAEPMPAFGYLPQVQIDALVSYLKNETIVTVPDPEQEPNSKEPYGFSGYDFFKDQNGFPAIKPPYGTLSAIDLNKGEIRWQVPLGEDQRLAERGIKQSGLYNRGGSIATAGGLIFIAATVDEMFRAYDQSSGAIVWEAKLPGNGTSLPATYAIDGKQYITLAVSPNSSNNYKGGYITFGL